MSNNTHTSHLISNLTDTHTSDFTRNESLFILTKHNYFVSIKEQLTLCYINEDYNKARQLCQIELDKREIIPTKGKTIYTLTHNSIVKSKSDTRQTLGMLINTVGNDNGWYEAIQIMSRINPQLDELSSEDIYSLNKYTMRLSKFKSIMKRKARLRKAKTKITSKKGKVTKYNKRDIPTPPSQR